MTEKSFQKILLEAVDSAFSSLGDSAKHSIYFHLEDKFKVSKDEIPSRLEDFNDGLQNIFGPGTKFLEILIMKKLYEKVEPKGEALRWDEQRELDLVNYVKTVKESFRKKKRS